MVVVVAVVRHAQRAPDVRHWPDLVVPPAPVAPLLPAAPVPDVPPAEPEAPLPDMPEPEVLPDVPEPEVPPLVEEGEAEDEGDELVSVELLEALDDGEVELELDGVDGVVLLVVLLGEVDELEVDPVPLAPLPERSQPARPAAARAITVTAGMSLFMTSPIQTVVGLRNESRDGRTSAGELHNACQAVQGARRGCRGARATISCLPAARLSAAGGLTRVLLRAENPPPLAPTQRRRP